MGFFSWFNSLFTGHKNQAILEIDKPEYARDIMGRRQKIDFTSIDEDTINRNKTLLKVEITNCLQEMAQWADSKTVTDDCGELLNDAQKNIDEYDTAEAKKKGDGKIDYLRSADNNLIKVRERLIRAARSKRSKPLVTSLFIYQLVILAACIFLLVYFSLLPGQELKNGININLAILFSSLLVGSIGGIFDGLWALRNHYSDRNFDEGYTIWYFANSILGGILGAIVFAAILAGLLTTTGSGMLGMTINATANETAANAAATQNALNTAPTTMAALVLVIAFLAGFKQRTVVNWLEDIARAIFHQSSSSSRSK